MNPLSEEYLPENILHRESQLDEIRECFDIFNNNPNWGSSSLALLGVTGSGKTTIIKKVINEKGSAIYINGAETKTPYKTLQAICSSKVKTHSGMLQETLKFLKINKKIIVIDEADKIKNLNSLMTDLNVIKRKLEIPVILVTLKRNIVDQLPSDVRKTFFFQKINLPSYNAIELQGILRGRLKLLEIKINEEIECAVHYISAIAAKQGSARVLMSVTLKCLQKNDFSEEFIDKVYDQIMKEDWVDFVNDINDTEKAFLKYLLENCDWESEISSEEVQKNICRGKFTAARISQLVNTFERYSAIRSRHQNLGRGGGRKRMIRFTSEEIFKELNSVFGYGD